MITYTPFGLRLIEAGSHGLATVSFDKVATSDTGIITEGEYPDFDNIKQAVNPSSWLWNSTIAAATVSASFDNNGLTSGYDIRGIGLYATSSGTIQESTPRLFCYEVLENPEHMPAGNQESKVIGVQFNTSISNSSSVTVNIEEDQYALATDVQQIIEDKTKESVAIGVHAKNRAVHNITCQRLSRNIRFEATADFNEGDSITINGLGLPVKNAPLGGNLFCAGDTVLLFVEYPLSASAGITVYTMRNQVYGAPNTTEASTIYEWLRGFPLGVFNLSFGTNPSVAIGLLNNNHSGLLINSQMGTTKRSILLLFGSTTRQVMYYGIVNTSTGEVALCRTDNNIINLPSYTNSLSALQSMLDSGDYGHVAFFCLLSKAVQLGLPSGQYYIFVEQNDTSEKNTIVTAHPVDNSSPSWSIAKSAGVWESEWTLVPQSFVSLTSSMADNFNSFFASLKRGVYQLLANSTVSSALGLPVKTHCIELKKISYLEGLIEAKNVSEGLATYYGEFVDGSFTAWKKVTLHAD